MQKNIVLDIFKDCDFYGPLARDNFEYKILENLPDNFNYEYFYGASKLCIIPIGANYVIKIPFNSVFEEYFDEEDEFIQDYIYFSKANKDSRYCWDFCSTEMMYYHAAEKEKIHKMFCKTRILGYIDNYPIYVQERATPYCYLDKGVECADIRTPSTRNYFKEKKINCFNSIWIADALEYYGEKTFNRLISFIKKYNITDLHDENIGYIGLKPVLIDYSDYISPSY